MIRLVERDSPADTTAVTNLARTARHALDADGLLIVELLDGGRCEVLAADGLSEPELEAARVVHAGPRGDARDQLSVAGFGVSMSGAATVPGAGTAAAYALQRRPGRFRNPEMLDVFARQAAIWCGTRRQPLRLSRPEPSDRTPDALGLWNIDRGGYDELNCAIAEELGTAVGAAMAGVFVWEPEERVLRPLPGVFASDPDLLPPAHAAHDWSSSTARVFATGVPYLSNRAGEDPGVLPDYVKEYGLERLLCVPIDVGGRRVGVLHAANKATDFTIRDVHAALALAPQIAAGVQVTRMRHSLLHRQRLEEILGAAAIDIASGRDFQEFFGSVFDSLCAALHASMITLLPGEGPPLVRRHGEEHADLEPMVLSQARQATTLRVYGAAPRRAGERSWAAAHVPVTLSGQQVATLSALRTGGSPFDRDECGALSRLAHLTALAWATERYQRQLADSARVSERRRIADELHDQVAQLLFAARLSLDYASEIPDVPPAAGANIQRARELLVRADVATRNVMEHNTPDSEDRLSDQLAALVGSIEEEFARPVALEVEPPAVEAASRMSRPAMNLVARAAREALVNAAKHAGPCQLAVRLTVTHRNRLLLTVTDGGIGVGRRREEGYGTAALRRAVRRQGGVMRVNETSTGGTKVAVSLPL